MDNILNEIQQQQAENKIKYWKTAGAAILEDKALTEKWCSFVDRNVNDVKGNFPGMFIDETLLIMSMIKAEVSPKAIAKTLKATNDGEVILDYYLGKFIHPEILGQIKNNMGDQPQ